MRGCPSKTLLEGVKKDRMYCRVMESIIFNMTKWKEKTQKVDLKQMGVMIDIFYDGDDNDDKWVQLIN